MRSVESSLERVMSSLKPSYSPHRELNLSINLPSIRAQQRRCSSVAKNHDASNIDMLLKRIRGSSKYKYKPIRKEYEEFRKNKKLELKNQYMPRKHSGIPFNSQVDSIVMDCWEHGEEYGRSTVWKKYRQRLSDLSYDTHKVLLHKVRL